MKIIMHRLNTVAALSATPSQYGVEVDIRSYGEQLVAHHDPFVEGEDFSSWLNHYRHGTLILNVKEEGLEERLLGLMTEKGIEDFFFLDQSVPFLVKTAVQGERRCAARVSEFEPVDSALRLSGMVDWAWIDCFSYFPLSSSDAVLLRQGGFKLCVVSPELQGRTENSEICRLRNILAERDILPDAVCTKHADQWLE